MNNVEQPDIELSTENVKPNDAAECVEQHDADKEALSKPGKSNIGDEGRTSSTWGAAFNILCTVIGTGLVQLPYAAAQAGWVSLVLLVAMAAMACYTADLIVRCLKLIPGITGTKPETYADIGEAVFGKAGKYFVAVVTHATLIMAATIYNLLAGLNLVHLFPSWEWLTVETAILIVAAFVWFHVFLKTLGEVAWLSALNFVVTLTLAVVAIVEALRNPPSEAPTHSIVTEQPMAIGGAFASIAFAFAVHPIIPTVYRSMRSPNHYRCMIILSFIVVLVVYFPMMCIGYDVYGSGVKSPIYNTPEMVKSVAVDVVVALITMHLIGAYAIVLNPTETELESTLSIDKTRLPLLWRMCVRTTFVVFTAVVAISMRTSFPPLVDFVGSLTITLSVYILPCVFYALLTWKAGIRLHAAEYCWMALIVILSGLGSIFGTMDAVKELIATV